jgi:hypothetical protein
MGSSVLASEVERLRSDLAARFPSLHVFETDGVVRGTLPIEHDGVELDGFLIEVALTRRSETDLPVVREVGGRIPWLSDLRHINADGSACVCLPEDYFLKFPGRFELLAFLSGPVRSFFLGQALVERGEQWPQGEWAHGETGKLEWCKEVFAQQPRDVRRAYLRVLAKNELRGHHLCPCGSERRIRDCHLLLLMSLRAILPHRETRKSASRGSMPTGRQR